MTVEKNPLLNRWEKRKKNMFENIHFYIPMGIMLLGV